MRYLLLTGTSRPDFGLDVGKHVLSGDDFVHQIHVDENLLMTSDKTRLAFQNLEGEVRVKLAVSANHVYAGFTGSDILDFRRGDELDFGGMDAGDFLNIGPDKNRFFAPSKSFF